ncbi:MAG TPA: hypothetical protein VEK57_00955 [Thermoanaerobaculia bacterium]|nr:hypothetical protein [Thermoanaerobaculia bacterium]
MFVAFLAICITTGGVYADDGGINDPLGNRIRPPIGVTDPDEATTAGRIGPPIGATANDANIDEPPSARILPPLPTTRERMTLADRFWTWLQSRIGSPLSLN